MCTFSYSIKHFLYFKYFKYLWKGYVYQNKKYRAYQSSNQAHPPYQTYQAYLAYQSFNRVDWSATYDIISFHCCLQIKFKFNFEWSKHSNSMEY